MRDFHATNWTKSRYGAVIITFKIQRVESYPVSISLPHAQLYLGSGFNPLLQRNAALPVDGLRLNIRGISPVKDSALNRCSSVHVQLSSSTWELESQTDTSSSLISGKERAEVPGSGKTDGWVFLPAVYTLLFSVQSQCSTVVEGRKGGRKELQTFFFPFFFFSGMSHTVKSYGQKLAPTTCGINRLVSTRTWTNLLWSSGRMMGLITSWGSCGGG